MDKMVVKKGKIFQIGDYPDKNLKMDLTGLKKMVGRFSQPVPLDLNHHTTLKRLDSKLGRLTKVWHDDAGAAFGEVEIPEWLNNLVCKDDKGNDLELPVSCALGKDDEGLLITKLALTDTPRVSDAAVFAAFSAAHPDEAQETVDELVAIGAKNPELVDFAKELAQFAASSRTNEGQSVLQQVHDTLARAGAVCSTDANFHLADELSAIQKAHDEVKASGASCTFLKDGEKPLTWFSTELSEQPADVKPKGDNMDSEKLSLVQRMLKLIEGDSAAPVVEETKEEVVEVKGKAKAAKAGNFGYIAGEAADLTEFASPEVKALREQLAEQQKLTDKLIKDGIASQAKIIANELIAGKHAEEKQRVGLEATFSMLLADDQNNPTEIQFSADSKGSRVDALKALYEAKTIVPLTEETVNEKETEVLLSDDKSADQDATKKRLEAVRERALKLADKENKRLRK